MPLNANETQALIAHAREGGPEGETAERMLGALSPVSPFMLRAMALIEEARDLDGLRDVAATATALKEGARARGMGVESENVAAEVILRAERAMGQALVHMSETGERRAPGSNQHHSKGDEPPGLPELGISMKYAHQYQTLARVPADVFEMELSNRKVRSERLSKANFYALGKPPSDAQRDAAVAAPVDPAFAAFRAGAYAVLEWHVGEDGEGAATGNAFRTMHAGDLSKCGVLLKALVEAYKAAYAEHQR